MGLPASTRSAARPPPRSSSLVRCGPDHAVRRPPRPRRRAQAADAASVLTRLWKPETVDRPVVSPDIHPPVCDGDPAVMIPRRDLVAARPELTAGLPVQRVKRG